MRMLILGITGFFLYFIYDINSVKWKNTVFQKFFGLGSLFLVVSTIGTLLKIFDVEQIKKPTGLLFMTAGLVFLGLLIYTLFFALPFDQTYLEESRKRLAYTEGMYGLSRHPGVLWFTGLYLCLWGLSGFVWEGIFFIFMILCNVLYVIFQDIWTFPRTFTNYSDYKKKTPFLIPDKESIRVCISSWNILNRGER